MNERLPSDNSTSSLEAKRSGLKVYDVPIEDLLEEERVLTVIREVIQEWQDYNRLVTTNAT